MENSINEKFNIKNLGFIKDGEIEVKPLTIICGQNNTGKTWAMYALYGFLEGLTIGHLPGIDNSLAQKLVEDGQLEFDLSKWINEFHSKISSSINEKCKTRLDRVFNIDDEIFESTTIKWDLPKEKILKRIESEELDYRLELGKQIDGLRIVKPKGKSIAQITLLAEKLPDISFHISHVFLRLILGQHIRRNVFLVPAERNGLHLFFRELSTKRSALLHHASREEFDFRKLFNDVMKSRYAEPIADYIDWLNELRNIRKNKKKSIVCHAPAEKLKKSLVQGKYEVDSEGVIFYTPQKKRNIPQGPKLSLHLTSSTIKSMFGLWFFLEHQAKPGDILMIDEPELNLHPGAQRRMARILASVANQGINVIVSTHSDYFIREINSLIMLSANNPEKASLLKKHDYSEDEILSLDNIAAYIFDSGTIKPMEINQEEGISAETFDQVIHDLNQTNDEIYYSYQAFNNK